jgi:TRAP-type C4-dicarboxylate transport system permease small subunit
MRWVKSVTRGRSLSDYLLPLPFISLVLLEALVMTDASSRWISGKGLAGALNLEELLMVVICFFSVSVSWREGDFIRIDLLSSRFPKRTQLIVDLFAILLALGCCVALIWFGIGSTVTAFNQGLRPPALALPLWPWKLIIPIGALFLCYEMVARLIQNIRQLTHKSVVL